MISMAEFLKTEGLSGGLNPKRMPLPDGDVNLWGRELWYYLSKVADATPGMY